jgi:hypothetical protein
MKRAKLTTLLAAIGLLLFGCYPEGPEYIDEFDLVLTNYDPVFSFTGKNQYAMPDSIVKIDGSVANGDPPAFLSEPVASDILNRIETNMTSHGYTRVADASQADFILFPSEVELTYTSVYYDYYYYWDWYYPCCYGWYYPYTVVSSYTTGSIIMNLMSPHDVTASGKMLVTWTGLLNGVLDYSGTGADKLSRIYKGIDQAFAQSKTYLHP